MTVDVPDVAETRVGAQLVTYTQAAHYPVGDEWNALKEMARMMCVTEFVPKDMRGKPYSVLGALLTGRDLGVQPMLALKHIYVINARPALDTALQVGLVRRAGHSIVPKEWTAEKCVVHATRKDTGEEVEITWTIDEAQKAGLVAQSQAWQKYPKAMLWARAAGQVCTVLFQDVVMGLPNVDEARDIPPEPGDIIEGQSTDDAELPKLTGDFRTAQETAEERQEREAREASEARERVAERTEEPKPTRTRSRRGTGPGAEPPLAPPTNPAASGAADPGPSQTTASSATPPAVPSDSPAAEPATTPAVPSVADLAGRARPKIGEIMDGEEGRKYQFDGAGWKLIEGEPSELEKKLEASAERAKVERAAKEAAAPPTADPFEFPATTDGDPVRTGYEREAMTLGVLLTSKQMEKRGTPIGSEDDLADEAGKRLDQVAQQMFKHRFADCTNPELVDSLLPWLRKRAKEEGVATG